MDNRKRHEIKLNSLAAHIEYLDAVAERHRMWANDVPDHEIENLHLEIIGLIRQTREKYIALLDKYDHH